MSAPAAAAALKRKSLAEAIQEKDAMRCEEDESVVEEALIEHDQARKKHKTAETEPEEQKASDTSCLDTRLALPVPAGAIVGVSLKASAASSLALVRLAEIEQEDERPYMERFWESTSGITASMIGKGLVKVKNPDQAMLLWSKHGHHFLHCLELEPVKVKVSRSEGKKFDFAQQKQVGTGDWYINTRYQREQTGLQGEDLWGLHTLSCFGANAFLKHGHTKETGLEGNRGRIINGAAVAGGSEQYQLMLTAKAYNHNIVDNDTGANPMVQEMLRRWTGMTEAIMTKCLGNVANFVEVRNALTKIAKQRKADLPSDTGLLFELMRQERFFSGKVKQEDEDDAATESLAIGTSCYRGLSKAEQASQKLGVLQIAENPNTDMFHVNATDAKGQLRVHARIPVYRCRRADEVEPGVHYASNVIRVPDELVKLSQDDVLAVLTKTNIYEFKLNSAGITNKQTAYIWLNTREALKRMVLEDIVPCDPRYAVPMAGYMQLTDGSWHGGPPPGWVDEQATAQAQANELLQGMDGSDLE